MHIGIAVALRVDHLTGVMRAYLRERHRLVPVCAAEKPD